MKSNSSWMKTSLPQQQEFYLENKSTTIGIVIGSLLDVL